MSALRRLPSNLVDVYAFDGRYVRACDDDGSSTITCVTQPRDEALSVRIEGDADRERVLARVRRMLGTDRELSHFYGQAEQISWLAADTLNEDMLEAQSTAEAASLLRSIKGIGPWTAAVILLRGVGRLDAFPANDSGVAANLALVAGTPLDAEAIAEALGPQRGMLYFCLLLARLEARGEVGQVSDVARGTD